MEGAADIQGAPYGFIAECIREDRAIFFLGAGASAAGVDAVANGLPTGAGLAQQMIEKFGYPGQDGDGLTKITQWVEETVTGRGGLYGMLHNRFHKSCIDCKVPPVPDMLGLLAQKAGKPLQVITTNYDPFVERSFESRGCPYIVLTHPIREPEFKGRLIVHASGSEPTLADPQAFLQPKEPPCSLIYKMHGTFEPAIGKIAGDDDSRVDTIVITESDYINFLIMSSNNFFPRAIQRMLQKRHVIFLGYSLADWNFRVLHEQIRALPGFDKCRSWAVCREPSPVDRAFWNFRQVSLYDIDLVEFMTSLLKEFE